MSSSIYRSGPLSAGFNFASNPVGSGVIIQNNFLINAETQLNVLLTSVNGDIRIDAKLAGESSWTSIYVGTGTDSTQINISNYDVLRIITESNISAGTLAVSTFAFSVANVGTIVTTGNATSANQVTANSYLNQIKLNQDSQTAILNTIASNTSVSPSATITLVDTTSQANIIYVGEAASGSSPASAVWKISKIDKTAAVTSILLADGNADQDNIWNNRLSGSYS